MKAQEIQELITLIFKALALGMSAVVVVLSALGVTSIEVNVLLLGIGLFCVSLASLQKAK